MELCQEKLGELNMIKFDVWVRNDEDIVKIPGGKIVYL